MTRDELIEQWGVGLRISHRAHFEAAKYYERLHLVIGVPTVLISAMLGTTIFASLQKSDIAWIRWMLAVLSVTMIALTSLQTFLRYSERSERHRTAAVQIGEIRREFEQLLAADPLRSMDDPALVELRKKWDAVDRQAPTIPTRTYERIESMVRRQKQGISS